MFDFRKLVGEGTITSKLKWLIVGLALLVETVLSIQTIIRHVEGDVMKIIASFGVSMLAVSLLVLARQLFNGDIKFGAHRTVAISVMIIELLIMTFNLIVALSSQPDWWMVMYAQFVMPATPAVVVGGQFLIWMFDPMDRARIEQEQAEQAEKVMETRFRTQVHVEKMRYANEFLKSDHFQQQIANWAQNVTQQTLNTVSRAPAELPMPTQQPQPQQPPQQPAQPTDFYVPITFQRPAEPTAPVPAMPATDATQRLGYANTYTNGHHPNP